MTLAVDVIKRGNRRPPEKFQRGKLHASVLAACLSARTPEGQSDTIAQSVCGAVILWLENHPEVTSQDIRIVTTRHLKIHHPEAAYLYEQNRITI